jgi:heterodisulfide reductase subunit B
VEVETEIGHVTERQIAVRSFLDVMVDRIGLDAIGQRTSRPLAGLTVACYYGCLLTRPPTVTGQDEPEYPMAMDRLMTTLGASVVDWGGKTSCCGGSLALTQTEIALDLTRRILTNARAAGADVVAVSCPMCHANLDGRQNQMTLAGKADPSAGIPVLYFTQLMALAFGLDEKSTALAKNLVDPRPLLADKGLLS